MLSKKSASASRSNVNQQQCRRFLRPKKNRQVATGVFAVLIWSSETTRDDEEADGSEVSEDDKSGWLTVKSSSSSKPWRKLRFR
jgi:hypothetical protein